MSDQENLDNIMDQLRNDPDRNQKVDDLDANADARIDGNDAAFGQLRLWFDTNGNGSVNPGELMSLADAGVSAINLSTQGRNVLMNGNSVIGSATFEYASGRTGTVYEVNFATSGIHSVYSPPADFEYDLDVLSLPHLRGYGLLPDLHIAMSLDAQLKSMVTALVDTAGSLTGAQFQAATTAILYRPGRRHAGAGRGSHC